MFATKTSAVGYVEQQPRSMTALTVGALLGAPAALLAKRVFSGFGPAGGVLGRAAGAGAGWAHGRLTATQPGPPEPKKAMPWFRRKVQDGRIEAARAIGAKGEQAQLRLEKFGTGGTGDREHTAGRTGKRVVAAGDRIGDATAKAAAKVRGTPEGRQPDPRRAALARRLQQPPEVRGAPGTARQVPPPEVGLGRSAARYAMEKQREAAKQQRGTQQAPARRQADRTADRKAALRQGMRLGKPPEGARQPDPQRLAHERIARDQARLAVDRDRKANDITRVKPADRAAFDFRKWQQREIDILRREQLAGRPATGRAAVPPANRASAADLRTAWLSRRAAPAPARKVTPRQKSTGKDTGRKGL